MEEPVAHLKPRLITFGISHFCEKARWALDWHAIDYKEIGWPPGLHRILAKRCGAQGTTLPILLDGDTVIQGPVVVQIVVAGQVLLPFQA